MSDHHHHAHSHGHHHHHHGSGAALTFALFITLLFAVIEVVGGFWSQSLALLGDAGHMASDAFALGLAAFAAWLAKKPPSARHSYGMLRAEVIAAFFNGLFMLAVVMFIAVAAVERLQNPPQVDAPLVMVVAFVGLLVNILVAWILMRGEQNMNTRGALLHVMGDLLGSVAALASGVVIYYSGWMLIDPLLSLLICALIVNSTVHLLRDVLNVIMEGVPPHLDLEAVGTRMAGLEGVKSVHDLHIWTLASGNVALSAHIVVADMQHWPQVLNRVRHTLEHDYGIGHVTLQPETPTTETFIPVQELLDEKKQL